MFTRIKAPSAPNSGMGANFVSGGGASFRVWTPSSSAVTLKIRVDGAAPYTAIELVRDAQNGAYWSADVGDVKAGHRYRFKMTNAGSGPDNPGGDFEHVDPHARAVESSATSADGFVVDPTFSFRGFRTPFFENFIIYQLHVGSFAGLNDGVAVVNFTATFADVIAKLNRLAGLGFNAVQLLPTGEYPGDRNEGYAPTNFFAPESAFGAPVELRRLVDECHARGLAVILDVIYNHVPDTDSNLWQFDGNRGFGGGGIYFQGTRAENFGERLGIDRTEVRDFFLDNVRMWFREYRVDGLRFDSAHNIAPDGALHEVVARVASEFPDKLLIAEHNNANYCLAQHAFGAAWDLSSADDFRAILGARDIEFLRRRIDFDGVSAAFKLVRYLLGSHDQIFAEYERRSDGSISGGDHSLNRHFVERVGDVITGRDDWTARAKARLGWALNVAMPGTPMMFMGTEVDHHGYWCPDTDIFGDHRFDFGLVSDEIGRQMQALVRDANNLRWARPALRSNGRPLFTHADPDNGVLAFKRFNGEGDVVLVVVNIGERQFDDRTYGIDLGGDGGTWEEVFNSQAPQYGGWKDSGNFLTFPSVEADGRIYIRLPKLAVLVFRKQ